MKCSLIGPSDAEALTMYFDGLSDETKNRFGPHPFDIDTVAAICNHAYRNYQAFVCTDDATIAAYTVVAKGYIEADRKRYEGYDFYIDDRHDCTLAPSVADAYQSKGLGSKLYVFVEEALRKQGVRKIVLWGGVQLLNDRAVRFYQKHRFRTLGQFHHDGMENLDMVKEIGDPV